MQAVIMLGLFGLLVATVGGIMNLSSVTTQKLRELMTIDTQKQMAAVATILNDQYVPQNMQSPVIPGGAVSADIGAYICDIAEIQRVLDCTTGVARDGWGQNITGKVVRKTQVFMTKNGLLFNVPVTAYAMLSGGPDNVKTTTIPTNPTQLSHLTALSPADDDILYIFSDAPAQQQNAANIDTATSRIGQAAQRYYRQQFNQFISQLPSAYTSAQNINIDADLDLTSTALQNAWKVWVPGGSVVPPAAPANGQANSTYLTQLESFKTSLANATNAKTPTFKKLFSGTTFVPKTIGVDGEFDTLQRTLADGLAMKVNASVGDSDPAHYGINDVLRLRIDTPTGLAWQQAATPNCAATPPVNCIAVKASVQ